MATMTYDSELMTQQVAAVAVPNTQRFVAASDENGAIMVFSLGTDGVFYLVKENSSGARVLVNLSAALKISPAKVTAFDVAQNTADSTLYIVFATVDPATPTQTNLQVLKPFKPSNVSLADPNEDLSSFIMPGTGGVEKSISTILMDNSTIGNTYPDVIIAYVGINQVSSSQDLGMVQVNSGFTGWQLQSNLQLPENAFKIISFCPARLPVARGFFALYEIQNQLQLVFTSTSLKYTFNAVLTCPPGAKSLATFIDVTGYTGLLVGGQTLTYWAAQQCQLAGSTGTILSSDPVFSGVEELFVAQTDSQLSIFASNTAQGLGYALGSVASITTPKPGTQITVAAPVPLIPNGQAGTFSPLISGDGQSLQLVTANTKGALSLLRQDVASELWNPTPFYTPNLNANIEFQAYTVHVNLQNADLTAMPNQPVLLTSSGWVDIIVNGRSINVGPTGVPVVSDTAGVVTLLIPTEDISSYTFTMGNADRSSPVFGKVFDIDPTFKVNKKLSAIQNGNDLRKATLQSGGNLLDGTTVSNDQINQAATAISQLCTERQSAQLKRNGSLKITVPRTSHKKGTIRAGKSLQKLVAGYQVARITTSESILDMGWDAWNFIVNTADAIKSWAVEMATDGLNFIIETGQSVWRWAVNTVEEIGKAISWVFDKILEIAGKIIDWLGFIFAWKDIQATHLSLVSVANSALQSGSDNLNTVANQVENWFDNLEATVRQALYPAVLTQTVATPASTENPVIAPETSAMNSTQGNYTNYQFSHGGAAASSTVTGSQSGDPLHQAWTDVVEPAVASLQTSVTTIGEDLVLLFNNSGSTMSVDQVLQKLGVDVLIGIIDAIKSVIVGLINLGADIIRDLKMYLNYPINIPIFSALYKTFISGGTDLSVLDGLCLLIAIPVTILSKLLTQQTPADLTSLNYDDLVQKKVTDATKLQEINGVMSLTALSSNTLAGLLQVTDVLSSVAPLSAATPQLSKFYQPHPLLAMVKEQQNISSKHGVIRAADYNILTDWKLGLGLISKVATIPAADNNVPGLPERYISWYLGLCSTLVSAAIRSVADEGVPPSENQKALGAINGVLALINFALVCSVNGLELTTDNWPGKDDTSTSLRIISSIFDLVSAEGAATSNIVQDPEVRAIAEIVFYAGFALSTIVTGCITLTKYEQGQYNYILDKI